MPYKKGFGPFAPEVYRAPGAVAVPRHRHGDDALAGVRKLFKSQVDPRRSRRSSTSRCRARAASCRRHAGLLEGLMALCREHGIVYIDDEVQAGMGRTGPAAWRRALRRRARPRACGASRWAAACRSRASPAAPSYMDACTSAASAARSAATRSPASPRSSPLDEVLDPAFQERSRELGDGPARAARRHRRPASTPSATCAGSAPMLAHRARRGPRDEGARRGGRRPRRSSSPASAACC